MAKNNRKKTRASKTYSFSFESIQKIQQMAIALEKTSAQILEMAIDLLYQIA